MVPAVSADDAKLRALIDGARTAMEGEMGFVRARCRTYLNWYSPEFNTAIARHDAWESPIDVGTDTGLTRDNFPISRAVVDIWTSLEASAPVSVRAEAEKISAPAPTIDPEETLRNRQFFDLRREVESMKSDVRSSRMRRYMRKDKFALKHYNAVRRKNLYGFTWQKILPNIREQRPYSHVVRDPTNVFPIWSTREPDDVEAILCVYQESAIRANERYDLGLTFKEGTGQIFFDRGYDTGRYLEVNDRWYDSSRTMVWIEEFWWIERSFENGLEVDSKVHMAKRICDRIVEHYDYPWKHVPFTYWQNTDERDSYGWSDIAGVIDINDEINRRMSQEGDIIGMYAAPRFQMLGSLIGRDVEMPDPFEMISLQDTERIEQILTRIDAFPSQVHFRTLMDDILPRVTGLPPIVWGMIANAQTSGRALTASWKATEARLSPKLMRNEQSLDRYLDICIDYARTYDWDGSRVVFAGLNDRPFDDWRWVFPPMEPRDFQEVTMDAITRRDAHLTTTIKAMRDVGEEDAEDLLEAVKAENLDIDLHPDSVQARLLAERAQLDNEQYKAQLAAPPQQQGAPAPAAGAPQQLPPGQPPAEDPNAPNVTTGTLMRNGAVSTQILSQGQL